MRIDRHNSADTYAKYYISNISGNKKIERTEIGCASLIFSYNEYTDSDLNRYSDEISVY